MNRNLAPTLAMGTAIAAAVAATATMASGKAFADDITIDNTPFLSSRSRADVQAELMSRRELARSTEWAMQRNQLPAAASSYTAEQARSEYKSARQYVNAITGEDSGSAYFAGTAPRRVNGSATMGGPAR